MRRRSGAAEALQLKNGRYRGKEFYRPQNEFDYVPNIRKYKPKFFVHGSDWKTGVQKKARERVIEEMKLLNGHVIEPEYTKEISSSTIINSIMKKGITPEFRLKRFRRLLQTNRSQANRTS